MGEASNKHKKPAHGAQAPRRRVLCRVLIALVVVVLLVGAAALWILMHPQTARKAPATEEVLTLEASEETPTIVESSAPSAETPEVTHVTGTTASGISYEGNSTIENSEALAALEEAVALYQSRGQVLSVAMYDLQTNAWLTYQPDSRVYSASAIKGPYCIFLCSQLVDTGRVGTSIMSQVAPCIQNSDNDAYRSIRSATIHMGWGEWLQSIGVPMEDGRIYSFDNRWYTDMSAADFVACWRAGYDYLAAAQGQAPTLVSYFCETLNSPLHAVLGETYTVWSKAGWYDGVEEEGASATTNDAGIVFADSGTYVVAVMSNAPTDFASLEQVVDATNRCHGALTGGATESLITENTDTFC